MRKFLVMSIASLFSLTAFAGGTYLGIIQGKYVSDVEDFVGVEDIPGDVVDQIKCEGLPKGLECIPEYDEEEDETDIEIEGVVTAAPGTYNVVL